MVPNRNFLKMSLKATPPDEQIVINRFAFCLLKHFKDANIKVQDFSIKIQVDQLCGQDFAFLIALSDSLNKDLCINVRRSGKGVSLILGAANVTEIPEFLKNYKRGDEPIQSY